MPSRNTADTRWLDAAARLAGRAVPRCHPNPGVGCILVKDRKVVGRGWTQPGGRPHAEAVALAEAGAEAKGATAYVTLEPCAHRSERGAACANSLVEAGLAAVVIGQRDPDPRTDGEGAALLREAAIEVRMHDHAASGRSLAGYLMRKREGRPFVTLKLATSLDGRIALPDGSSQWITGAAARTHVHARRARHDAIVVGGGTWRADRPRLDVRLPGLEDRSPQRVLLSRSSGPDGVRIINTPAAIASLEEVLYLYVEGGAETAASFLRQDFVDRLEIYRAPILIGNGLAALGDIGLTGLAAAHGRWTLAQTRTLGSDLFTAYDRLR
ncbi:bifunctional diaminohydroxyphosphoribosylaminopyrimidine deaminase/5-amino-6-(5-phosphoribosylamino)uracil reductase RibD [Qipengyuania atrilutea]|uniref:Riboflavin biosynthesis protein RibD n=1 Tax=Qipengyuania atrilutea TaxID=2744473 RepID=A0A850H592_9SPHN|nr:bifunctional diaminohydroxyphosphoribosylaminopyrimidine deaminase/5-amino-6-(5-phosphoribosylamino)uracil reductase RibD [Actirhodobacter atriluteus]